MLIADPHERNSNCTANVPDPEIFLSVPYPRISKSEARIRILEATLLQIRPDPDPTWPLMRPLKNILVVNY